MQVFVMVVINEGDQRPAAVFRDEARAEEALKGLLEQEPQLDGYIAKTRLL